MATVMTSAYRVFTYFKSLTHLILTTAAPGEYSYYLRFIEIKEIAQVAQLLSGSVGTGLGGGGHSE